MEASLYHSILADPSIKKVGRSVDRAIKKELESKVFPVMPDIGDHSLSVSFPAQIGFARYDIETAVGRNLVGRAFAVEHQERRNSGRRGVVTVLLLESPIDVAFEGWFVPKQLEVWHRNELLGKVVQEGVEGHFKLSSRKGGADISLRDAMAA